MKECLFDITTWPLYALPECYGITTHHGRIYAIVGHEIEETDTEFKRGDEWIM